ncbi:MAG: helix-turn-helix transcriptional regulator [Planctomycetota bacterium]
MTNPGNDDHAGAGVAPEQAVGWLALVEDAGACVLLLDRDGTILFANEISARMVNLTVGEVVGKRYTDFLPSDFANERVGFFRRVAETGVSMVVEHTFAGVRRRTSLRAFPADAAGNKRVLMVCRPALAEDIRSSVGDAEYVQAKVNDLGGLAGLTPRELEILCLIGQGMATADIAKLLHRSEKTVEWHRVSLGTKLGVTNRVELARIAIRSGMVQMDAPRVRPASASASASA